MKTKSLIAATVVLTTAFSSQVFAQESPVERVIGQFISNAVSTTSYELQLGVKQAIANATYNFELKQDAPAGKVSVTDLVARQGDDAGTVKSVDTETAND